MSNLMVGFEAGLLTFVFAYGGMWLQKLLPEAHMTSGARDMIGAVLGLIALLLALVLGTLVGSAYGFFATQKANVETLAARSILIDMAFRQFGPEAEPLRLGLKAAITDAHHAIWIAGLDPSHYPATRLVDGFQKLNMGIAELQPKTPQQTAAMPTINISVGSSSRRG